MVMFLSLLFVFVFGVFLWTCLEPRWVQVNRPTVTLRKQLHRPVRILHLSDTHFGIRKKRISHLFDQLAKEDYDFVFLTGDIIDCEEGILTCLESLLKLRAHKGIWAVFGNHDFYNYYLLDVFLHNFPGQRKPRFMQHTDFFQKALEDSGIRVLRNKTEAVDLEGVPVLIHGLDDATTGHANVREAMRNFDADKVNFLLTHTIDVFLDIGRNEIDLSFSGHSHGGQICLPYIGPLITHTTIGRSYVSGIKRLKGAFCCISRGVSAGRFFPFRLLCPPEVIVLTVLGKGSTAAELDEEETTL